MVVLTAAPLGCFLLVSCEGRGGVKPGIRKHVWKIITTQRWHLYNRIYHKMCRVSSMSGWIGLNCFRRFWEVFSPAFEGLKVVVLTTAPLGCFLLVSREGRGRRIRKHVWKILTTQRRHPYNRIYHKMCWVSSMSGRIGLNCFRRFWDDVFSTLFRVKKWRFQHPAH